MEHKPTIQHKPLITVSELYYAFFKHKKKIMACTLVGVAAAAITWSLWPVVYEAEAKLFVRYVLEDKAPAGAVEEANIKMLDQRGETILNSELEILTSLDLAEKVVEVIGPKRILAKINGETNAYAAAVVVKNGVRAEIPNKSSVVRVIFRHPDPELVKPVLAEVVGNYVRKHSEVHRAAGLYDDFLTQQTGELRLRLKETEDELRKIKNRAGVFSLDESQKAYADQLSRIRQEIFNTQAEIAERNAMVRQSGGEITNTVAKTDEMPNETIIQHQHLGRLLEALYSREQELLIKLAPGNPSLKTIRSEIERAEKMKSDLEQKHDGLALIAISGGPKGTRVGPFQPQDENVPIVALQSRIRALNEQMGNVRKEAAAISELEPLIVELERKKELQESQYRYFSANLEQARIDETLRAGTFSNISVVQQPSLGTKYVGKLNAVVIGLILAGLLFGIGLACFIEFYLDQSVRRPVDVETRLGLPLFFSIPWLSLNGHTRLPWKSRDTALLSDSEDSSIANVIVDASVPWAAGHPLRSSLEALRDRLTFYFDIKNLKHKPKLVAVTSTREGAGVSTIAAGLASTLSETGDGNVLLVDMNFEPNVPHFFQKGRWNHGLETVLDSDTRDVAMLQERLYLASSGGGNSENKPRALTKGFVAMVPKLKASDYDFIIFDMPPVSQNSVTPQMARYMDIVLMVVESENNDTENARRAGALIKESQPTLGVVLNKTRNYVPRRLLQGN